MNNNNRELEPISRADNGSFSPADRRLQDIAFDVSRISGAHYQRDDQKSLADYARGILARKWVVIVSFILGLGIAGFIVYKSVPHYISTATIEINRIQPSVAGANELFLLWGQSELFFQSQIEALQSRGLAERFLAQTEAKEAAQASKKPGDSNSGAASPSAQVGSSSQTEEHAGPSLDTERNREVSINSILGNVKVEPIKGTRMIRIEMGASDPTVAKEMLEGYIKAFVEQSDSKQDQLGAKMRTWLDRELAEAENRLKDAEKELLEFSKEHDIVVLGKSPNPKIGEFEKAGHEWLKSQTERIKLEEKKYEKERSLPIELSDSYLESLRGKLAALKSEYTSMEAIYSPEYFKMALLRKKISGMEQAIADIEQSNLSSAIGTAKRKEHESREAFQKAKSEAIGMNSVAVKYSILKKAVEANESVYHMLLKRSKEAELDHGIAGWHISVMSSPTLPLSPVRPKKAKILFTGAVLGLLAGIGLAFCLNLVDTSVQSTQDIQDHLSLPVLGTVPMLDCSKFPGQGGDVLLGRPVLVAHRYPSSPFTEAIRIVQNAACAFLHSDAGSSMVVTSALPLEGKTLMAVVMGTVVASEKKKALLIDGDLRSPSIHKVFQSPARDPGLSDLLTGQAIRLRETIRQTPVPGLYYIPAGSRPENPAALLKDARISDIIQACKKVFDVVIIDAPPILGLVDARIWAGQADGIIMISRAGHTPVSFLRQARDAVYQARGRLLGIVLNMADARKGYGLDYYSSRYYNRYYHRYYHDNGATQDDRSSVILDT